jgi:hypothetical protein
VAKQADTERKLSDADLSQLKLYGALEENMTLKERLLRSELASLAGQRVKLRSEQAEFFKRLEATYGIDRSKEGVRPDDGLIVPNAEPKATASKPAPKIAVRKAARRR